MAQLSRHATRLCAEEHEVGVGVQWIRVLALPFPGAESRETVLNLSFPFR